VTEDMDVSLAVTELFRRIASQHECARFELSPTGPNAALLPRLTCSVRGSAAIAALAGNDQIDLYIGADTWLEMLPRRGNVADLLDRARLVVEAVVAGRFEETLWEARGKVVASRALITLADGSRVKVSGRRLSGSVFLPRPTKRRIRYEPYA
jgi:hypothetical protein